MNIIKRIINWFTEPRIWITKAVYDKETKVMTITHSDGNVNQYKGSCTVWYKLPYMKRCGTSTEYRLCEIIEYINHHGNPFPTAHDKDET